MSEIRHDPRVPTRTESHDAGDTIDRHRHDEHQLIYVSTGVLAITTALGSWVASADRAVWIPAGIWHEHRFYGSTAFHTVGFPLSATPFAEGTPAVLAVDPLLRELLIAVSDVGLPTEEAGRIRAVVLDRLSRAPERALVLPTPRDPRLAAACAIVESGLATPRSLSEVAVLARVGERTLSRLFRSEFGMTYPQWRTRTRVFRAAVLLASGATVTEAGRACGWSTTSAFVDVFRRAMGRTPGARRVERMRA